MNRSVFAGLLALAAFVPFSSASAQAQDYGAMSSADHAAMQGMPRANGVNTSPVDNAMLATAPTTFSVSFPHPMTLATLTLSGEDGQAAEVAVAKATRPATTVTASLPDLAPGSYSIAWSATGTDGHAMNGTVRFMVH